MQLITDLANKNFDSSINNTFFLISTVVLIINNQF